MSATRSPTPSLTAEALREQLCDDLAGDVAPELLGPLRAAALTKGGAALAFSLVDAVARSLTAAALVRQGKAQAATELEALAPLTDDATVRAFMVQTEKVGRRHDASPVLLRAAGGAAATLLRIGHGEAAQVQLIFAVVRVVGLVGRAGVPTPEAVSRLVAAL